MNQIEMVKIMKKIQKDRKRIKKKISKGEQNERRKRVGKKKQNGFILM